MRTSLAAGVATLAVTAAGLAVGTGPATMTPPAAAAPASNISKFAYKASVFGTKVVVDNVVVRTLKDAQAQQPCTRRTGLEVVKPSAASLPVDNDLIKVAASTSSTDTYRKNGVHGVRGVNTISDIAIGGELPGGVRTPVLKIQGLRSVADAFHDRKARGGAGAFGHDESFSFKGLSLEISESDVTEPIQDLLDIINQTSAPVSQTVNQVIALLDSLPGDTLQLPGLGSIGLGRSLGKANASSAWSAAYALRLIVDAGEDKRTMLQLGRAETSIERARKAGVFRSKLSALELLQNNATLHLGGGRQQSLPCSGTNGKVVRHRVGSASVLKGALIDMTGIEYAYKGTQNARGQSRGWARTSVGQIEIPTVGLVFSGVRSRLNLFTPGPNQKVRARFTSDVAEVLLNGKPITLPKPGHDYEFDGGFLRHHVVHKRSFYGAGASALSVFLTDTDSFIDLGQVNAQVFYR